jgi:UDPglucose 6-dehydrogenase
MRESPAITLVEGLLAAGAAVHVHDPKAMHSAREVFGTRVRYFEDSYAAADGADALVVMTEWLMYRTPDFDRLRRALKSPVLVDARNLYDPERMKALGFRYDAMGRRR